LKLGFGLFALVLTAPAQELPLPPGAVMAVQIQRPAALASLAAELKIPGGPSSDKLSSIIYASYPGDKTVLVLEADSPEALDRVEPLVRWLAKKSYTTRIGNRVVVAPDAAFVRPGLASSPLYLQARQAAASGAAAWAFVNMAMLKQYPPAQKALGATGSWPEILLSGAIKESLSSAHWLSLSLRVDGRNLILHAASDGQSRPDGAGAFSDSGGAGLLPNLRVPGQLAAASFWRDLGKFYAARDTLFPEKTSGGILFENFMEIFFTGRDLNAEVFARIQPEIRLVVAKQRFDPRIGTPVQQYPAAALIMRVNQGEEFGEMLEEAWQKAIGLQNFTRGQQALPGLIFDRTTHGSVPFTYCYYSAKEEKDREHLPSRYNVRPALARVGPYMVLSTTDALAADVIDALHREDGRVQSDRSTARTLIEISSGVADLLKANRGEMVRQSMMKDGKKAREAEAEFDRNLYLLGLIDHVKLTFSAGASDLEVRLK
jgi:hypothetical protein